MSTLKTLVGKLIDKFSSDEESPNFFGTVLVGVHTSSEQKRVSAILDSIGYRSEFAIDTSELVNRINVSNPRLVIIDSDLPGVISGIEAAKTIYEKMGIPIVALLSMDRIHSLKGKTLIGVKSIALKPVSRAGLLNSIDSIIKVT